MWTVALVSAGFDAPEALKLDGNAPYHNSAGIIAARPSSTNMPHRVTLLCHKTDDPYATDVSQHLQNRGVSTDDCLFGDPLPPNQDIISLLDLQQPTVFDLDSGGYNVLMNYLQTHKERILWVMPGSQINCADPRAGMTLGLARTARNELSVNLATVEIDKEMTPASTAAAVAKLLCQASPSIGPETLNPDYEFAVVDDEILIPRFHWQTAPDAAMRYRSQAGRENEGLRSIQIGTPGLLRTMSWSGGGIPVPADGEVLVKTEAVGLNFRVSTFVGPRLLIELLANTLHLIGCSHCSWRPRQQYKRNRARRKRRSYRYRYQRAQRLRRGPCSRYGEGLFHKPCSSTRGVVRQN